jgi:hypothetical protein
MRQRRRLGRVAAGVVLVLTCSAGAASHADLSTSSPAPGYLSGLGNKYELPSNRLLTNAKQVGPAEVGYNPLNKPAGEAEVLAPIWTRTCTAGQDSATFRRTIEIPGPPTTGRFEITPIYGGHFAKSPLRKFTLLVNDQVAATGSLSKPSYFPVVKTLPAASLPFFENGPNVITVKVARGDLPRGMAKCNSSADTRVSVRFRLSGDFVADLALVDTPPPDQYRKAQQENTQIVNLSLRNLGPSAAVAGGTFVVTVNGVTEALLLGDSPNPPPGVEPLGPPFDHCTRTETSPAPNLAVRFDCVLTAMRPGDSGLLSIGVKQTFQNTNFSESSTILGWHVVHPADTGFTNNERSVTLVWCGTLATSDGCAGATG